MRAIRDLRDLVNVSRLTYREDSDNEIENNFTFSSYSINNMSSSSLNGLNKSSLYDMRQQPVNGTKSKPIKKINSSTTIAPIAPIPSKTIPVDKSSSKLNSSSSISSKKNFYVLSSVVNNPTSSIIFRDRDLLLDRNSLPIVQFSNFKKPLPPLSSYSNSSLNLNTDSSLSLKERQNGEFDKSIEPLALNNLNDLNDNDNDDNSFSNIINDNNNNIDSSFIENSSIIQQSRCFNGNFDDILTFVDASVVSDWLNRANRYLKKMLKWHQDNTCLYPSADPSNKFLKYESFVLFCNFWLGKNEIVKFTDKQRRQLIEMEYSIIKDEVMQAFQVGLDSQSVSVSDVNQLLKAVFKEYPIQLLSFRGTYLILDFVDVLSSDRDSEYKQLLSDVKCRTVNKQYAQWLLSIRSFALINLCWSIIKFYRKTVYEQTKYIEHTTNLLSSRNDRTLISELDGRLSSLSVSNIINKNNNSSSLSSSTSSLSSNSSSNDLTESNRKSAKSSVSSKSKNQKSKSDSQNSHTILPSNIKYEYYLEAVFKNDLPDVLHYLITTKKCDPYKKDSQGKTLIFLAVMNEKPKILNYLVKRWPSIDINDACDSGNTPLHAAVNKGKLNLVEILLESLNNSMNVEDKSGNNKTNIFDDIKKNTVLNLNKTNPKCMNATALHLAVWNDYNEIAIKLIQSNADPNLKMNGLSTAFDLARENSNEVLYDLLVEYTNMKNQNNINKS